MKLKFSIFLITLLFTLGVLAKPLIDTKNKRKSIIRSYLKVSKDFSKKLCPPGAEAKYWKLVRKYRGEGFHIPLLPGGALDKESIKLYLPQMNDKINWINQQLQSAIRIRDFNKVYRKMDDIRNSIVRLLRYKEQYHENKKEALKGQIQADSRTLMKGLRNDFLKLAEMIPFFTSYKFPLDHLRLRQYYDRYKHRDDYNGKREANKIYLYRRIVQDGAQNKYHKKNDIFLRTTLDTVYLQVKNSKEAFLSEDLRYDLTYILNLLDIYLKRGKTKLIERLTEWLKRSQRNYEFYKLLAEKFQVKRNNKIYKGSEILEDLAIGRLQLKEYIYKKQAEVYEYWIKKSELMRALYVMDTILYNEAGSIDGRDALERRDINQVVINRSKIPFYTTITKDDEIYSYLSKKIKNNPKKYKWMNVLFKEGEFSFTYFYIPSTVRVFCPERTRIGRFLHKENVGIALDLIEKPKDNFKALRYFSRASMLGRIDMTILWKDFELIPEKPGLKAKKSNILLALYKKGSYQYRYNFKTEQKEDFKVVEILKKNYVIPTVGEDVVYKYRSPHYFKYFRQK